MPKAAKTSSGTVLRDACSGKFTVAKQAVKSSKFTEREIRDAVRKVVNEDKAKRRG